MILNELFNSKIKPEVRSENEYEYKISTEIAGRHIYFDAIQILSNGWWDVEFYELKHDEKLYHSTQNGGEFQVFSFVVNALKHVIEKHKPEVIIFSADKKKSNRSAIYQKIAKKIPGYKVVVKPMSHGKTDLIQLERI